MKNEQFVKLSKAEKLKIKFSDIQSYSNIDNALFIPLTRKSDGYTMSAFFVEVKGIWYRLMDYDSFRFVFENLEGRMKGDFENHGVQFFLAGEYSSDYGGEFIKVK